MFWIETSFTIRMVDEHLWDRAMVRKDQVNDNVGIITSEYKMEAQEKQENTALKTWKNIFHEDLFHVFLYFAFFYTKSFLIIIFHCTYLQIIILFIYFFSSSQPPPPRSSLFFLLPSPTPLGSIVVNNVKRVYKNCVLHNFCTLSIFTGISYLLFFRFLKMWKFLCFFHVKPFQQLFSRINRYRQVLMACKKSFCCIQNTFYSLVRVENSA